jgi:glutamate racemase
MKRKIIGVFDSGVGGLSVVHAIEKALPEHSVLFENDTQNVPYGTKSPEQLLSLVLPILQNMQNRGCNVIVIACNTITTTLIPKLRQLITVPLIGMEPMIKPATSQTNSGVIAVFATPTTLASQRYHQLKKDYAKNTTVLEPNCSDWAFMIENNQLDQQKIKTITEEVCRQGADIIVLGCTHYHWIEELIKESAGERATVLQPEQPVISQISRVLQQLP